MTLYINNAKLYQITKVEKWSKTIKRRRLNWLGHIMRLEKDTPARIALYEHLVPTQNKRGRPKTTWMKTIKKDLDPITSIDLNNNNETINILENLTEDREQWKIIVKLLMQ